MSAPAPSTPPYDLVLVGGRVIDPASEVDAIADVAIADGRIAAIGPDLGRRPASASLDVAGRLVLPGLIDTHAHVFHKVTGRFGLPPDLCGVAAGVTTLVDQGGPSCITLPAFRSFIAERSRSRVLAFLSAYVVGGLEGHYYPDLYGPHGVDVAATVRVGAANRDLVRGIKAHAEIGGASRWGLAVIRLAAEAARALALPLYVHFGQLWPVADGPRPDPDRMLDDALDLLAPGDVVAHPFSRHPGAFIGRDGAVLAAARRVRERGLRIDVGHGSHFSFAAARAVLDAGILPDTLGADMHGYNTAAPPPPGAPDDHPDPEMHAFAGQARFSLVHAMSELLALGLPLSRVVAMTTTNAAALLGLAHELGALAPGRVADVTVLDDLPGRWRFVDNGGIAAIGDRLLRPAFCLRAGVRIDADSALLPEAAAA